MRVLVAPQEFKGTFTAAEATAIIATAVRGVLPEAEVFELPLSDGGPGLVDALVHASGGRVNTARVHDALMRPVEARWGVLPDGAAVIETAAAAGLTLIAPDERRPLEATTYGVGELVRAALDAGCGELVVGVGGSATTDAGAGALQALGVRLLDGRGEELPPGGGALVRLTRIDASRLDGRARTARIRVATDVRNTLCGPAGAARMFAPQKGASPADVEMLERALARFAEVARHDLGVDVLSLEGGGAAGGLAAGLAAALGATIEPGFAVVANALALERHVAAADIIITGEGRLDAQTAYGKAPHGVAEIAHKHGKRVVMIAGSVDGSFDARSSPYDVIEVCAAPGTSVEEAMGDARRLLGEAAARSVSAR